MGGNDLTFWQAFWIHIALRVAVALTPPLLGVWRAFGLTAAVGVIVALTVSAAAAIAFLRWKAR